MTDSETPPPPPPPAQGMDYALLALGGIIVGLLIAVVFIVVSSGDEESTATTLASPTVAPPTAAPQTTGTTAAPATTAAATTVAQFSGDTLDEAAAGDPFGTFNFLHDVRFQQRGGFTRVVFDFEDGDVPWWSAGYTPGPFTSIGDEPIPVAGTDFLRVVLSSTTYDPTGADVRITYPGPQRITADTSSVTEIVLIDDFEGVSTWVIGINGTKPFAVGTLTNPPRFYVDIGD